MITVLFGEDDLAIEEALAALKADMGPAELRDVNITVLDGAQVGFEELTATCDTVPFLSEKRMVIVKGLLSQFERGAARGSRGGASDTKLGAWEGLPDYAGRMPPTTELVLVDGRLGTANPMLAKLRSVARVQSFPLPTSNQLQQWVQRRAQRYGIRIEPKAVALLADTIGPNVRVMDLELQKLALYRQGQTVLPQEVEEMVSYVKEASIFQAVDAILEGRTGQAMRAVRQILEAGRPATYVITMIGRQVRLLLLAKEMRGRGLPQEEIGRRLSLPSFAVNRTMEQERRFTEERLIQVHRRLLEADLELKTSTADETLVLDTLIAELSSSRGTRASRA